MTDVASTTGPRVTRARNADIDDVAVQRCAAGRLPHTTLTVGEREAVVALLNRQRLSDCGIARRTGMCSRTVLRIRQRLGLSAAGGAA